VILFTFPVYRIKKGTDSVLQMKKGKKVESSGKHKVESQRDRKSREEKIKLAEIQREGRALDAELSDLRTQLQNMRELWLTLIQDGKIQYIPREQSQSHGQQQEDSFGAALLDSPPFDDTSGQEALAFIETYMMGFSDNYRDVNEPFDNLGDDLHCVLEDPCTTFDSIVVEGFW